MRDEIRDNLIEFATLPRYSIGNGSRVDVVADRILAIVQRRMDEIEVEARNLVYVPKSLLSTITLYNTIRKLCTLTRLDPPAADDSNLRYIITEATIELLSTPLEMVGMNKFINRIMQAIKEACDGNQA